MKWRHNEVGILWWCWDAKKKKASNTCKTMHIRHNFK
jgi:hypothetical protein